MRKRLWKLSETNRAESHVGGKNNKNISKNKCKKQRWRAAKSVTFCHYNNYESNSYENDKKCVPCTIKQNFSGQTYDDLFDEACGNTEKTRPHMQHQGHFTLCMEIMFWDRRRTRQKSWFSACGLPWFDPLSLSVSVALMSPQHPGCYLYFRLFELHHSLD